MEKRTLGLGTFAGMNWRRADKDRFTVLMRPHFDALYAAARRLTLSTTDAEDLVQDVCVKAYLRIDELTNIEYQRAWLLKILYHQFIDNRRARERSPVDMADTGADSHDPENLAPDEMQPDELVDRHMRVDTIIRAMEVLNREATSLLALHDIEGFSLQELRELTGMPLGTIKSRLYRTRSKLGRLLSSDAIKRPALKIVGNKQ